MPSKERFNFTAQGVTDREEFPMPPSGIVFLFDVDNTLLDNDRVTKDLQRYLEREVGHERRERYWTIFEQLRVELGYADYLGALQRYRTEYPRDPHLLTVSHFLINYPFADRLYPNALEVIEHVKQWGPVVILSDGDVVFQPRKVERSGLFEAVGGNVRENHLGLARHDRVSSSGPLCHGPAGTGSFSTGGRDDHPHRGLAQA